MTKAVIDAPLGDASLWISGVEQKISHRLSKYSNA